MGENHFSGMSLVAVQVLYGLASYSYIYRLYCIEGDAGGDSPGVGWGARSSVCISMEKNQQEQMGEEILKNPNDR
jgi:hypothetical protein